MQEIWNSFAKQHKLSQIKDLTTDRKAKLRKRLENPLFKLYDILEVIKTNDFLKGGGWVFGKEGMNSKGKQISHATKSPDITFV